MADTATTFAGIHNENEFYSHHYLSEIFIGQPHPPRWIILLSPGQVILIERGKWTHNRLLRFDLDDVLGRREDHTLKAAAALLHCECLLPEHGASLLDSLDDNSHKHAFAVSEDLKYALRESIELIGNEAIWYLARSPGTASTGSTTRWPAISASRPCATCTGCCSCSTSRRGPTSATRRSRPRRTARATAWNGCAIWRWCA